MKRKSLILLFIMVVVISNLGIAFAETDKNPLEVKENEVTRTWIGIILNMNIDAQTQSYYCGPASGRAILSFFGHNVSQNQIARDMGTTSDGTSPGGFLTGIVKNLGNQSYYNVSTSSKPFKTGTIESIDADYPVGCAVMTGVLPIYEENNHNTGHFLVIKGYYDAFQGSTGASRVVYLDPNNDAEYYGQQECAWSKMISAVQLGGGVYTMKRS